MAQLVMVSAAWMTLLALPCAGILFRRPAPRRPATPVHRPRRSASFRRLPAPARLPRRGSAPAPWARRPRPQNRELRRFDRDMQGVDVTGRMDALPPVPIEQLAHDLRRLDRQRRGGPMQSSEATRAAVLQAYDARLRLACRCLGVPEHLQPLQGVDREIERLRVEERLAAAGLALRGYQEDSA
ncbi:hypothetical protein [Actinoplanes teichomyceticus]|uniref:Uncharacterized protein n=1 Tax=Actinoplanes teichomyceticus TaxID=1867 RepID=A0A561WSE8_ACTTI|nr:hypothetical protein [Actinoplanes teichomyceticus]TWG26791.1 hypothetical protein FHX34_1011789 [Actinoplanes teichomyceticus]GIF15190.1 hypothetical protein Ate01nite_52220 [Actinoplanes teichomyceticus]